MTTFLRPDPAPLPTGGLAAVVQAGRHRRTVATSVSGATAAGLAVLLLTGGAGERQSLQPVAPDATPATTASYSASPSGEPAGGGSGAAPSASPTAEPGADPSASATPSGDPSVSLSPSAIRYERAGHHTAMRSGMSVAPGAIAQGGGGEDDVDAWLVQGGVTTTNGIETTYTFRVSFCAMTMTEDVGDEQTMTFGTDLEADFAVVDDAGREVWRWSDRTAFAAEPHSYTVRGGQCLWWETDWRGVDNDVASVPAGSYTVRMYSTAEGHTSEAAYEEGFVVG